MSTIAVNLEATFANPKNTASELMERFGQDWGTKPGPQKVDGKTITQDPFFDIFLRISQILTDEVRVTKALTELNNQMLAIVPPSSRSSFFNSSPKLSPKEQVAEVSNYLKARYPAPGNQPATEKNKSFSKLFTKALLENEHAFGFKGDTVTLGGGLEGEIFIKELIIQGRRWKDVGVPGMHGEYTHRVQWFIVSRYLGIEDLRPLYRRIGEWTVRRNGSPSYLALWDALFDRAGGNTNPFERASDKDFRSPETLSTWMLKPENENSFPLVCAYLQARFNKRDGANFTEYVARKLFNKSLADLQKAYLADRSPKKLAPLQSVCDATGLPIVFDDVVVRPPGGDDASKLKILEQNRFAKNKYFWQ
jgi:hypothetical protein